MRHRNHWVAWVAGTAAVLALAGCAGTTTAETESEQPAKVEQVPGSEVSKLTLTQDAVDRLGLKTEPVGTTIPATIPLSAVFYDKDGKTWTFTNPEPRTYLRQPVTIASVAGQVATLQSGPAPGTAVVTVGGAELLGAEYGVEGG
jgi:ABC-type oligopeptide transport system substrate-binding subunit